MITVDDRSIRRGIAQFNRSIKSGGFVYVIVENIKAEDIPALKARFEADWRGTVRELGLEVYKD